MEPRARIYKNKIEIINLLPFPIVMSKRSPYIVRISKTAVFVKSPLVPDLVIPIPISTSQ
jgi:hypothetical protein